MTHQQLANICWGRWECYFKTKVLPKLKSWPDDTILTKVHSHSRDKFQLHRGKVQLSGIAFLPLWVITAEQISISNQCNMSNLNQSWQRLLLEQPDDRLQFICLTDWYPRLFITAENFDWSHYSKYKWRFTITWAITPFNSSIPLWLWASTCN